MDRKFFKILIFFLAAGWLMGGAQVSWAKFPDRKIRFIVPMAPGGGADTLARTVTRFANPYLQEKLYVENVTGGGGAIGFREGAKAAPDGYTLTMLVTTITIAPHVTKGFPTVDLFDPICILATDPMMLTVHIESPYKTVAELIAYAKANPGKLSAGTSGQGSPGHLGMAAFADATGTQFTYVPFKGSAPVLAAAAGKHIDVGTSTCSEAIALVGGKKLRPLVVLNPDRSPLFPEVPTTKEIGLTLFLNYWRAMAVPKGTPSEVKTVLVEAFRKAMEKEEVKKFLDQQGLNRVFLPPEQAGPWLKNQHEFFGKIAKKIGLQPQ
ncbi:MAG TPA: tripartite tricarboxylate transporter substrate binding protein [Thermodesulfobacteriota bacterium]